MIMKEEKRKIGRILRSSRLEKGLTLEKASKDTKITQKYLKAIEDEQFSAIPGEVVLKGFIRIYADYLKIDPKPLIGEISKKPKAPEPPTEERIKQTRKLPDLPVIVRAATFFAAGVLAILIAALLIRSFVSVSIKHTDRNMVPKEQSRQKTSGLEVSAQIMEKTWIMVISDGRMVFKDIVEPGRTLSWRAKDTVLIKLGNAAGARLFSNGRVAVEPGAKGQVLTKEFSSK